MAMSQQNSKEGRAVESSGKRTLSKVIAEVAKQCGVLPSFIEDLYPCTPLQHGLLALSTASAAAYVAKHVFNIQKDVDIGRIKKAWETVIQRNAILRTRIVNLDTRAFQAVLKSGSPSWGDCTDLASYLANEGQSAMQYGRPLSRLAISNTHIVWTVHHSLYDAHSVELMLDDIAAAYQDKKLPVRPPFRNFIKYVQHRNEDAQRESFWTSRLSSKEVLSFPEFHQPNYRPRPNRTMQHSARSIVISSSQVTPATIVQAAWGLVLSSHLSSPSVSFGLTVNGRNAPIAGIENMMGSTLATVPVCLHVNPEQDVAQYLESVQHYSSQMIPHQQLGLQKIKNFSPEAAQACDFQNLLAIQSAEENGTGTSYSHLLKREDADIQEGFFNYALTLQCSLASNGKLRALAVFDETLIDVAQMQRLLFQLEHVIRQIVSSNRGKTLREISLVSPQDLEQIRAWNAKPGKLTGFPFDEIQSHFNARPDSAAVCSWDGELTYAELDDLSARLANHLISKTDVQPEMIVPVCFDRSFWMIVAVIAVLRTGAAFTLLDPAYPQERLEHIVRVTSCETVLVSRSCNDIFMESNPKCLVVDENLFKNIDIRAPALTGALRGCGEWMSVENAMYVVFTSGSTGEPKGVVITHGSYYAGAMAHIPYYELSPQSRYLLFGSPAFDLYIHEIISTLMAGGCICVPSRDDQMGDIASVIRSMSVNLASFTSSFARQIKPEDAPCLKILALVGEALAKDQQEAWADKVCLLNSYGPSECSVISTIHKAITKSSNTANIGSLIEGSSWIADRNDHDRLLPIGAAGELLIEGPILGRGYLNDPKKTAESFIENPIWARSVNKKSRRFYKTGDVVRYDKDGSLTFEGRKDNQIKIRGQRVELGEVEYQLGNQFPNASGVAVLLLKQDEVSRLVALVSCGDKWNWTTNGQDLLRFVAGSYVCTVSDIKSSLGKALPHHMIPTRWLLLEEFPLLPSGKLDRKKLQKEVQDQSGSYVEMVETNSTLPYIEPDDDIALKLSERLVKMPPAGDSTRVVEPSRRDLNLTSLELDSIQLISLLSFIRKEFEVNISIATLYEEDLTVSALAKMISDRKSSDTNHSDNEMLDLSNEIQHAYSKLLTSPASQGSLPTSAQTSKIVFLTGATGYLGSEILRQLLTNASFQKIVVHVRASDATKALDRIVHAASLSKWWSPTYSSLIECWPGDLAAPKLGLSPRHWKILIGDCEPDQRISNIIHNGAAVQWQAPYSALKAANVDSTVALLAAVRHPPFHMSFTYVSGGVKKAPGRSSTSDDELKSLAVGMRSANGYSQTKFVSEEIVARFARTQERSNVKIVRPGLIIGTEDDGIPNTDDFLWRLVQACATIHGYPTATTGSWLALADIQEIAAACFPPAPALQVDQKLEIVDIEAGITVQDFWSVVTETLDSPLQPMKGEDWVDAVKELLAHEGDEHPYRPLMAMLQESSFSLGTSQDSSVEMPKSHERVRRAVRKNLSTLVEAGFFSTGGPNREGKEVLDQEKLMPKPVATFGRSGISKGKLEREANAPPLPRLEAVGAS